MSLLCAPMPALRPYGTHPVTGESLTWEDFAACRAEDPALFWPEPSAPATRIEQAKAVCRRCPSLNECLDDALATSATRGRWGIRGGMTEQERGPEKRRRQRRAKAAA